MNTQNVNITASESSERWGVKADKNNNRLTHDQIMDVYGYIQACGWSTQSPFPLEPPVGADEYIALTEGPDVYTIWIQDGWPVMAIDEMSLSSWVMP